MPNDDEKLEKEKEWYDKNKLKFNICTSEVSKLIEKILNNQGIAFQSIAHRVKSENSFLKKCEKEKYDKPEEQITDMAGIRIITYTNKEVEQICNVINNEFDIDINNSGNKADNLGDDKVGYLSVHYVAKLNASRNELPEYYEIKNLKFEIQIRTLLQHAWAEIEHDRNYKFNGKLQKDLKRRFYLIAGVLELMDHEFEKLSYEIDEYAKDVSARIKNGDFNVTIDSTSLLEYMRYKFNIDGDFDSKIIDELKNYGLNSLKDIEEIITPEYVAKNQKFVAILRDVMIINNVDKYFNKAYSGNWKVTYTNKIDYYKGYGVDIEPYLNENNIEIKNTRFVKKTKS
jgi:Uncharacterized protein conserved in bacteria